MTHAGAQKLKAGEQVKIPGQVGQIVDRGDLALTLKWESGQVEIVSPQALCSMCGRKLKIDGQAYEVVSEPHFFEGKFIVTASTSAGHQITLSRPGLQRLLEIVAEHERPRLEK